MRLALKITLAVTAWTLLVLLVGGQLRLQRELELFDADMRQDSELLGAVLRAAVQDAHASGGTAAVDDLLLDANASEHVVHIRLVRDPAAQPSLEPAERQALADGQPVVLDREPLITIADLPRRIREYRREHVLLTSNDPSELAPLADVERRYILRVLEDVGGNKTTAAKVLGLGRKTLYRKLEKYGVGDEGPR